MKLRHVLNYAHAASQITHPCLTPPLGGIPLEFLDETYPAKTRGIGLLYGENCMILTSTVFDWSTSVTDRRTDGQTDGFAIAYSALSMLSCAKNEMVLKTNHTQTNHTYSILIFQEPTSVNTNNCRILLRYANFSARTTAKTNKEIFKGKIYSQHVT